MIRICEHLFYTNFCSLSPDAKILWLYAASRASRDGVVEINIGVLPRLAGLSEESGEKAIEELSRHNFYDDDRAPFLSRYEVENWNVSKVLLWTCRSCERTTREFIPLEIRQDVLAIGICAHCSSSENLEVDHIRPVSLGGTNDRENLQALCGTCNRKKLNRFIG